MTSLSEKPLCGSVASALLLMSFYGQLGREAYWGLALLGLFLTFGAGVIFFLRVWLAAAWIRALLIFLGAVCAQAMLNKLGVSPWWVFAGLSLLWTAVEEHDQPYAKRAFLLRAGLFIFTGVCFFALKTLLQTTESRYFWESSAGHWSLLGVAMMIAGILENRGGRHAS